jgi:hydrogenase maturation protein HypF
MKLEKYLAAGKPIYPFDVEIKDNIVRTFDLFRQIDEKIDKPLTEKEKADYVHSIVKAIVDNLTKIAIENVEQKKIDNIGLTGGVSYNIPITNMVDSIVKKAGLKLIVHNRIANGDGGISIGQNAIIGHKLNNV